MIAVRREDQQAQNIFEFEPVPRVTSAQPSWKKVVSTKSHAKRLCQGSHSSTSVRASLIPSRKRSGSMGLQLASCTPFEVSDFSGLLCRCAFLSFSEEEV